MNYRYIALVLLIHTIVSECKLPQKKLKNHDLLTKLGLSRVRAPNSHHKKRLAVESRQHTRTDDSQMFIIKLPPNQHYYVHNKPAVEVDNSGKHLPIGFKSNGRPGKIYHWNMPIIKKIALKKQKMKMKNALVNGGKKNPQSQWNEIIDKPQEMNRRYNVNTANDYKKPLYYVPSKPKKSSFFKYFPGNGKPKSFYVIEKSKKKHHHRLLS